MVIEKGIITGEGNHSKLIETNENEKKELKDIENFLFIIINFYILNKLTFAILC